MTRSSTIRGPQIPAVLLFRRVAPTCAQELSHQFFRAGLANSNDLIDALLTGLRSFAKEQGVCLAEDFPAVWPEALRLLKTARSENDWDRFLAQTATAPQATPRHIARGASQTIRVLEALRDAAGMTPRMAVALGTFIVTASVVAHSGPSDADLSLEELAGYL